MNLFLFAASFLLRQGREGAGQGFCLSFGSTKGPLDDIPQRGEKSGRFFCLSLNQQQGGVHKVQHSGQPPHLQSINLAVLHRALS